jgi:asparagine synthase (glutamine-hydrolysing)
MSPRYLLVVAREQQDGWSELLDDLSRRAGLGLAFKGRRVAVLVNQACTCLAAGEAACIIGTLFHRHGPAQPISQINAAEAASIEATQGDALLHRFWGGYVAAVDCGASVRVIRDPSAALSCYFASVGGCTLFAPDAELLVECGATPNLDWVALARDLYVAGVPSPETCLSGISELLGGFAVRIPAPDRQFQCWSPWEHVGQEPGGEEDEAAERLSRTVRHCMRAWSSGRGPLLLSVSGGLDSSIVAAALAQAKANVTCLTMYSEDPSGDERVFARALCTDLGLPLLERPYCLEDIDIAEPLGAHLPRPRDRTQALSYERTHLEVARAMGADAFVTGNGGDSVFGYSQSAAAIADRYLAEGLGRGTVHTLRNICKQTGCSLADAVMAAWRIVRGPRGYRCRPNPLFLDPELVTEFAPTRIDHPWLEAPAGALPGKAAHIAWILRVQQCLEPSRGRHFTVLNPLMSQPVVECCLGVPSWQWRSGGRDRALARRAFADMLPRQIVERKIKGSPGHFAGQILERLRDGIRERLLNGHLARQGIIDTSALNAVLGDERPCSEDRRVRILELVAAEAWLDSWASRLRGPATMDVSSPTPGRPRS